MSYSVITVSWSLLKFKSFELVMLSNHFMLCYLLLLLPSIFPSIKVFSNELVLPIRFPKSHIFTSSGQSIGASASASVLRMNIQGCFHLGLMGFISLLSKGLSRIFASTTIWKHQFSIAQSSLWSNSHTGTWLLEKP